VRKRLIWLFEFAGILAAFCVLAIFLIMIATTIMRELGIKTGGSDDVTAWLTASAAFLGLAATFRHGDFVRMSLVTEKLSPAWKRKTEILCLILATVFTGYIAYSICRFVYESYEFNDYANGLVAIPLWIPQAPFAFGTILLFLAVADQAWHVMRGREADYVVAVRERHARGDYSEDM
jgi:TRAP-type C4-dicarboxylate transport system permease small subunit